LRAGLIDKKVAKYVAVYGEIYDEIYDAKSRSSLETDILTIVFKKNK